MLTAISAKKLAPLALRWPPVAPKTERRFSPRFVSLIRRDAQLEFVQQMVESRVGFYQRRTDER
jgi:hypothetical protein